MGAQSPSLLPWKSSRARSSLGRAPPWHGGGSRFDPGRVHPDGALKGAPRVGCEEQPSQYPISGQQDTCLGIERFEASQLLVQSLGGVFEGEINAP